MTETERLTDFLFRAGAQAFCEECLSQRLGIAPAALREPAGALVEDGWCKRTEEPCDGCGEIRSVIRRRVSAFAS